MAIMVDSMGNDVTPLRVLDALRDAARADNTPFCSYEVAEDWVTDGGCVIDRNGDVTIPIPSTGSGAHVTVIDRANRAAIDDLDFPLAGYVSEEVGKMWGGYVVNLSEILRAGDMVATEELEELRDIMQGLAEYPVIDHERVTLLERTEAAIELAVCAQRLGIIGEGEYLTDPAAVLDVLELFGALTWEHDGENVIITMTGKPWDRKATALCVASR